MPIQSAQGLPVHTRSLTVSVARQSETVWHARGDVIDLRKNGFVPTMYAIQPSGIIHNMSIEIAFDPKTLEMKTIAVDQPFVAIEASEVTGGECCRDPAPRLVELEGDCLDADFTKRLSAHFGGALGCSHLLTLFQLIASTIPQAVQLEEERIHHEKVENRIGDRFFRRSLFLDGFEKDPETIEVTIQLADTHSRPGSPGDRPTDPLVKSHEWKTLAAVDRKRFMIRSIDVAERERTAQTLGTADWVSQKHLVSELSGVPLIPGLAGRLFRLFGDKPSLAPLLANLLQFAPGFIQVTAALMDQYLVEREATPKGEETPQPSVANIGGNANSCYMWRDEAPMRLPRP